MTHTVNCLILAQKLDGHYESLGIVRKEDITSRADFLREDDDYDEHLDFYLVEYPGGRLLSAEDMGYQGVNLSPKTVRRLYRRALLAEQDQIGSLGKYFYKSKFLHYLGLAVYAGMMPLSIWLIISDFMDTRTIPWMYVGCLVVYLAIMPIIIQESKEVHCIWRELKGMSQYQTPLRKTKKDRI